MTIGFVCTNYNNTDYTREAVHSLSRQVGEDFRIVVVDNNSELASARALEELTSKFENLEIIFNTSNLGYFPGLNAGIRQLRSKYPDIDFVVIGNNDLVFPIDFAESVRKNAGNLEKHAVLSPDIVTLDGEHQNPHVISKIGKFREVIYDLYYLNYYLAIAIKRIAKLTQRFTDRPDETQYKVAQQIYQGYGACYILGPVFFRHFNELWAPSFLMHEEYFLSKQLRDAGLHVYYEPSIKVIHHCHAAMSKVPARKAWQAARDSHRIYRQHVKIFS